jgi:hypothetical protein
MGLFKDKVRSFDIVIPKWNLNYGNGRRMAFSLLQIFLLETNIAMLAFSYPFFSEYNRHRIQCQKPKL